MAANAKFENYEKYDMFVCYIQCNENSDEALEVYFNRHERDACINNLKVNLNVSSTKADYFRPTKSHRIVDRSSLHQINPDSQERKRQSPREKYALGSLDNVSKISWEENNSDEQSTLRRTRSFAISRENLFYSLDYIDTTENKKRRAQLIPRAKLIEKAYIKDSRYESYIIENRLPSTKKVTNQPPEIPPDYSPLPKSNNHKNFPLDGNIYDIPPVYTSRDNSPVKEEEENLNADFQKKISDNSRYRRSLEDLVGLDLPNYYPDSELTDNVSIADNQSTFSQEKGKYFSLDNIPWAYSEQPESISYDDNIVLAKKPEGHYAKPRTLRGPTPYHNFDYAKLPQFSSGKAKKANEKARDNLTEHHSSLEFETNTNCDEIKLNNDNITREDSDKESVNGNKIKTIYSVNEIIDKLKTKADISCINNSIKPLQSEAKKQRNKQFIDVEIPSNHITLSKENVSAANNGSDNQIKTLIEVCSAKTAVQDIDKSENFKTIVTVDVEKSDISVNHEEENKSHSHNYLKEFLETQKGSKKPLQSFIAKKFSNLTRRNCKTNLVSNQFYSLPDITASKNLQKCERIDQKLRKCDKIVSEKTENRFIVNIGKHFDITAKSSVPVDFQVKIAKVPKKNRKQNKSRDKDKEFKDAVKNVNNTLQTNGFCVDLNNNDTKDISIVVKTTHPLESKKEPVEEMDPEIQEKLDNMRNYWTKIAGNDLTNEKYDEEKDQSPQCKIIEVQTKVSNVKKKFEPVVEINEEKPPNKVQLAKKLFEPKPVPEKVEKLSPIIKETCRYFENHSPERQNGGYESLCPNSVEIVTQTNDYSMNNESKEFNSTIKNNKPKKHLTKSNSISIPEFDHVRYKVIKPDLFNKKILANCEAESQFDGLIQYLQDYSFQELLIDNNIVIIEPIRSKVPHSNSKSYTKNIKTGSPKVAPTSNNDSEREFDDVKQGIRKHFFYHPIRVNKEVNDNELPNPEVVRQARLFFEQGLIKSQSTEKMSLEKEQYEEASADPDKDKCSTSDSQSDSSGSDIQENIYDSLDNNNCFDEYVSEDILEKIREYGTTVTYYGGKVVNRQNGQPILTKVIMEEIKDIEKRCRECNSCRKRSIDRKISDVSNDYQGIKFKLVKSNSCSSRLELVGATSKKDSRKKSTHKQNIKTSIEKNNNSIKESEGESENKLNVKKGTDQYPDKNAINENIKQNKILNQPRIIGEERKNPDKNKYIQWSEIKNDQTYATIEFTKKINEKIKNYDYHEKIKPPKKASEMEFEPYEVA